MIDLKKYDLPVPRYTSYPTVPYWNTAGFSVEGYCKSLETAFWESSKEVSLYIHLPYCDSLCTYCACNTRITKNHGVEKPYIEHLLLEWDLYLKQFPEKPIINEIHLGGGTPTFFSPMHLEYLIDALIANSGVADDISMSFEGHPANTTKKHLEVLYKIGFDRLSLGIQDFDPAVQKLINRHQTFDQVYEVTEAAREIGYQSINYDMVYGLPAQTEQSLNNTLDQIDRLSPNRIAYYSYAHVPKFKPAQKSYEDLLPTANEKYRFKVIGKERLVEFGYEEVGMDHFVLSGDELLEAQNRQHLHRNFMGYTTHKSHLLVGLGVSAISDSWTAFAQNEKKIENYFNLIDSGKLPIIKGHLLHNQDLFVRQKILDLMCSFKTDWSNDRLLDYNIKLNQELLDQLKEDRLINIDDGGIKITELGKEAIRVVCSALDQYIEKKELEKLFSQSI